MADEDKCFDCDKPAEQYGWCESCCPLLDAEKVFLAHYIQCLNQAEAVRRTPAYNTSNPRVIGSQLMARPRVRQAKRYLLEHSGAMMSAEEAMALLSAVARGDTSPFPEVDGMAMRECLEAIRNVLRLHGKYDDRVKVDLEGGEDVIRSILGLTPGDDD